MHTEKKEVNTSSGGSTEERVYEQIKAMCITYASKPGQRVDEIDLSKQFGVSRTPVRQALSRLNTEGFVRFAPGEGFYIRELNQRQVFALYELRKAVELHGVKLSIHRAKDADIEAVQSFLSEIGSGLDHTHQELVRSDEELHERLLALSENEELLRVLRNVNERIRFFRSLVIESISPSQTHKEHEEIVAAFVERNQEQAIQLLDRHMSRRVEAAVKAGILHIYM